MSQLIVFNDKILTVWDHQIKILKVINLHQTSLKNSLKNGNYTLTCHKEWRHQSRQEMLRDHRQQRSLLSEQEVAVALTS